MTTISYLTQIVHQPQMSMLQHVSSKFQDVQFAKEVKDMNNEEDIAEDVKNNDIEKGYITGFFDAEGIVRLEPQGTSWLGITQSYKPILYYIKDTFKEGNIGIHSREGYDNRGSYHKGASRWRVSSKKMIPFLEYIYNYSIEKRKQIELMLQYLKDVSPSWQIGESHFGWTLTDLQKDKKSWFVSEFERLKTENGDYIPDMPEDIKTGYFAGFFDGEGYVGIDEGKKGSYTLRVAINNSNLDILKMYNNEYGGKIRPLNNKNSKEHHKQLYQWYVDSNESLSFLNVIYPFIRVKKEETKYAIEFQAWHNHIGIITTSEQKEIAKWYCNILMELKDSRVPESLEVIRPFNFDELMKGTPFRNKLAESHIVENYLKNSKLGLENLSIYEVERGYWFNAIKNNTPIKICHVGRNLDFAKNCNYSRWGIHIYDNTADYFAISLWDTDKDTTPLKILLIHKDEIIRGVPISQINDITITNKPEKLKEFERFDILSENTLTQEPFIDRFEESLIVEKHLKNPELGFESIKMYKVNEWYWYEASKRENNETKNIKIFNIRSLLQKESQDNTNESNHVKYFSPRWTINMKIYPKETDYYAISLWENDNGINLLKVLLIHKNEIIRGKQFCDSNYISITNKPKYIDEFKKYEIYSNLEVYKETKEKSNMTEQPKTEFKKKVFKIRRTIK